MNLGDQLTLLIVLLNSNGLIPGHNEVSKFLELGPYRVSLASYHNQDDTFMIFHGLELICEIESVESYRNIFYRRFNKEMMNLKPSDENSELWTIEKHLEEVRKLTGNV